MLFFGSEDGRFFIHAFKIDFVPPTVNEDDEFSGDEDLHEDQVSQVVIRLAAVWLRVESP